MFTPATRSAIVVQIWFAARGLRLPRMVTSIFPTLLMILAAGVAVSVILSEEPGPRSPEEQRIYDAWMKQTAPYAQGLEIWLLSQRGPSSPESAR
jgi:hypothetical protein